MYDGVSGYAGGHEVAVVGYNDTGSYWIAKNSWGSGWGDAGFFKIAYGQCGFMSGGSANIIGFKWAPSGVNPTPTPSPSPPPSPPPVVCGDGQCSATET